MNDYLIYLCLPPYLAQWYANECTQIHNRDKDVCPREIYRFPTPVVPVRGSQESVAYIRTFNVLIFFTTVFIGAFLHSSADHPLQSYIGRALQGFTSSALLHNTKFGPFDLLPLKGDPSKVRSHPCANNMVYGRQIRYICLLCDNPCVFQIFVAPSNP